MNGSISISISDKAESDVEDSGFAYVTRGIAPAIKPAGIDSWQNAGALVTGFVAKEVVVGAMAQIFNIDEAEEEAEQTTFLQDVGGVVTSFCGAVIDTVKSTPLIIGIDLFEGEEEDGGSELMTVVGNHFEEVSGGHGALASVAFMVFVLLYTPCMVAVAAQLQEFGVKWALFGAVMQLVVAYVSALAVFQGGIALGLG